MSAAASQAGRGDGPGRWRIRDANSRRGCSSTDRAHGGRYPKIMRSGSIRAQIARDQSIGDEPAFLEEFAHQFQHDTLVSLGLDQHVEDLALGVDSAPQIDHAPGNLEINLVKMPSRVRLGASLVQICRDHRPEMVHPAPNRFVRDP